MNNEHSMHDTMKRLGIRVCPLCGREYVEHPAISRKDNKTEICPTCGTLEALKAFVDSKE